MKKTVSTSAARAFIDASRFVWHQRYELAPGVFTPGVSSVDFLLERAGVPKDLSGLSVLDVGTTNGACAFEAERRGATRVVAVDIFPPSHFGFGDLKHFLGSRVTFINASVYELPERLPEQFDLVMFFGVLYHLRHPLLALDRLWEMSRHRLVVETAVCDHEHPAMRDAAYTRFYRTNELAGDGSNWFAPSIRSLGDWVGSSGFSVEQVEGWPDQSPSRAMVQATRLPGPQEYQTLSYERPLAVRCA